MVSGSSGQIIANVVIHLLTVISAYQNAVTVTHNIGRIAMIQGEPFGTDDNIGQLKIINQGVNSFDIAFAGGITQATDTNVEVSYI